MSSSKSTQFFTDLVPVTVYRPALPEYPKVSNEIITAMEAVMTGQSTPDQAAKNYDDAVKSIVGQDKTTTQSQ
jgi:multiple sugar transport system substrate-binding protein